MISGERLKEIWDELEEAILYGDPTVFNIDEFREQQQMIDELLTLRSLKKRLIEDGERLAIELRAEITMRIDYAGRCGHFTNATADNSYELSKHTALLKELEE